MALTYDDFVRLLDAERLPAVLVDLDAVDANADLLAGRLVRPDVTVRVASKSIRLPYVLRHLLGRPRFAGLMTYSTAEMELLAEQGFDDLLAGYPVGRPVDADALARLARGGLRAVAMVDSAEHIELLASAADGAPIPVAIDLDASLRIGPAHLGVRRSPLRDPAAAVAVAQAALDADGVELVGLMAYEAQVAGLPDNVPGQGLMNAARRVIRGRSIPLAAERRAAVREAVEAIAGPLRLVNGGGTGSVDTTSADPSVTEITAGSGFFAPTLFDHYRGLELQPAAFFALPVVRRSDPDHVTCASGGFLASGPGAADRMPVVHLPPGLTPLAMEGWGEVQTPLRVGPAAPPLPLGAPVIARHAKAGELMERAAEVLVVRGGEIVDRAPTYRGLGGAFG